MRSGPLSSTSRIHGAASFALMVCGAVAAEEAMKAGLTLVLLGAAVCQANAAGGMLCSAEGGQAGIELQAGVARDVGSRLFGMKIVTKVDDAGLPGELQDVVFDDEHQRQFWFDEAEFRLMLYRELRAKPYAAAQLTLHTKAATRGEDGANYVGRYSLILSDGRDSPAGQAKEFTFSGAMECTED